VNVDLVPFTFENRQVRTDIPRRRTAALAYITSVPRPKIAVHRKTTFSAATTHLEICLLRNSPELTIALTRLLEPLRMRRL
jgi:hypothetical protein